MKLWEIEFMKLQPGDEYLVKWRDGDIVRYRVEEIRGDFIVRRRWIEETGQWTKWTGVQKASHVARFIIEEARSPRV